jgi:2-haloacid dehalogenase
MRRVCIFDVNETLLDVAALDPFFARVFGDAGARREWFNQMIQSALTATVIDAYADFGAIGRAALRMVAARHGVVLPQEALRELVDGVRSLPPHADVGHALDRLRAAGARLATLTNSTQQTAEAQMAHAGLSSYFERVVSADSVRRLKPAQEPYLYAAEQLGVKPRDCWLIAAHAWDVAGAQHAGLMTAFLARPGQVVDPLYPAPLVVEATLPRVVERILALDEAII